MADDDDGLAFKFAGREIDVQIPDADAQRAGVFHVKDIKSIKFNHPLQANSEILCINRFNGDLYITFDVLRVRLGEWKVREEDYKAVKAGQAEDPPRDVVPFDLWTPNGTLQQNSRGLILNTLRYTDKQQLKHWTTQAKNLRKRPEVSILFARFHLSPTQPLELVLTPAKSPFYGVDVAKLKKVVEDNKAKLANAGWPNVKVMDYATAEANFVLVGRNFLQLYFAWMKADDYEKLWGDPKFKVPKLLHALPPDGNVPPDIYKAIDEKLKDSSGDPKTQFVIVNSRNLGNISDRENTQKIMGQSATNVANVVWKNDPLSTGMGGNVRAEWLHRAACSLGGADSVNNLVFGTWECNTDMIRAENVVRAVTRSDSADTTTIYEGKLTTTNHNTAGPITRRGLAKDTTSGTIPNWVEKAKYSWLCLSLEYQYDMSKSRLPGSISAKVKFDPWSLYVPLNIEPRLDVWIINDLAAHSTTAALHSPSPTTDDCISHPKDSIPLDILTSDGGFVHHEVVKIFGGTVVGDMEKWVGPPPGDVIVGPIPPSIERVIVKGDLRLSTIIPLLRGTLFDNIVFRNVVFYHQNYAFDKTKAIGYHINANWVIDASCGILYNVLTKALQVEKPLLHLHASLGELQGWEPPLHVHSFILEGIFPDLTLSPVAGLTLTSIGVRLLGIRGFEFSPEPHSTLSFGFGVFGTMMLDVPGSVAPLNLAYEIGAVQSTVHFTAEISGRIWEDALGVKDLLLEDVVFTTTFSATSPWNSYAFALSATFSYLHSQAHLQGSYASGGQFSFTGELDNFGIDDINAVFIVLFSDTLTLPDFDVHIGSAAISIVSGQGLSIALRDVTVAECTSVSVELDMSSTGVSLSGALTSTSIAFGDVKLDRAVLQLSIWSSESAKVVDVMLGGKVSVDFLSVALEAVVHLYPGERGVEWAIVAALAAQGEPFALSNAVPKLKDSFVDFALESAVFIAASKDDPSISQVFPGYNIRQGIQVFGVIDRIEAVNTLLREEVKGLVLSAGWSKATGFNLLVSLPAESTLDLGNGIKTTPIALGIRTSPPELAISAGLQVPVRDSTPLDFYFTLAAGVTGAAASAQMVGWWNKPFGIDVLKIGPEVTLSIEIIYAQFISSGTPSGFGVAGGLMIGDVTAFLAMNVSEDPRRQMLSGKLEKLDISDVVKFAGTLVQHDIPKIPDDLLKFEELRLYICPNGVVVGTTTYPQGFSFKADLVFFGKRANIECTIDKAQKSVDIIGGVDNFELGPLTVSGLKGPRAELECYVGVSRQQLLMDGVITLFDLRAETDINVQFLPDPIFKFHTLLQYVDVFMFKLDAELIGSIRDSISKADFSLSAELQNDIVDYIERQVLEQLEGVKFAVTQDLEAAKKKVDEAEKAWLADIAAAEATLQEKRKIWQSYERNIRNSNQPIIDDYLADISRLQGKINEARNTYNNAVRRAERKLEEANEKRGSDLAAARRSLASTRVEVNRKISNAERALNSAEAVLSRAFGNAQRAINKAERDVQSLQRQIDGIKRTIRDYERAPWYHFWKKIAIPGLWIAVAGLEAARAVALVALNVARAVLRSSEYLAKEAGVRTAREALSVARSAGNAALLAAQEALDAADKASKALVDAAKTALEEIRKGTEYVAFEGTKQALEDFKKLNKAAYEAAMEAISGLMKSAEYIAFNAAEAALEVAKGATKALDAAKAALQAVEKASQETLNALKKFAEFVGRALYIQYVKVSGTLRGIVGIDGSAARPLSAVIKGFVVGKPFEINAVFDPRESVAFVDTIFKHVWDVIVKHFSSNTVTLVEDVSDMAALAIAPTRRRRKPEDDLEGIGYSGLEGYDSRFLEHEPAVRQMIVDETHVISAHIPRGIFSGTPMLPPVAVARRILALTEENKGESIFHDIGEF